MIISHLPMKMFSFARYFLLFYFRQTIQQTLNWKKNGWSWSLKILLCGVNLCFFFFTVRKNKVPAKNHSLENGKWNLRKNLLRSKLSISPLKQYRAGIYNDLHFIVHMWTHVNTFYYWESQKSLSSNKLYV